MTQKTTYGSEVRVMVHYSAETGIMDLDLAIARDPSFNWQECFVQELATYASSQLLLQHCLVNAVED